MTARTSQDMNAGPDRRRQAIPPLEVARNRVAASAGLSVPIVSSRKSNSASQRSVSLKKQSANTHSQGTGIMLKVFRSLLSVTVALVFIVVALVTLNTSGTRVSPTSNVADESSQSPSARARSRADILNPLSDSHASVVDSVADSIDQSSRKQSGISGRHGYRHTVQRRRGELEGQVDRLIDALQESLQDKEMVEITLLRRVYTGRAFLQELQNWMDSNHCEHLFSEEQHQSITKLAAELRDLEAEEQVK